MAVLTVSGGHRKTPQGRESKELKMVSGLLPISHVTTRLLLVACAFGSLAFSRNLPTFQWAQEVDASGTDSLAGVGTDAQGNVYVAGSTSSPKFPVQSAVQSHLAGAANCFVTKLDASGNVLYSTYFGGSGQDAATAMTVDAAGDVYVTGTTTSADFPTTKGAYAPPSAQPPRYPGLIPISRGRTGVSFSS